MAEKSILVVGDVMLDEYIFGKATRISPEAPVMVVRQERTARLPGGAANVARNVLAFGAKTHLIGLVGADEAAELLETALGEQAIPNSLLRDPDRTTTRKTRVVADHRHQVLRIDHEVESALTEEREQALIDHVVEELGHHDALILSDYRKGCLTERVARALHQAAKQTWKPLIVNPKPASLSFYRGATVISLNRGEASEAWGQPVDAMNAAEAASDLRGANRAEAVVVTLGEAGMVVAGPQTFAVAAPRVEVADPAGAGDTVIATVALGVAAMGFHRSVFELAAEAAASVVRHVGVATVTADDLDRLGAPS
jgi:D-beta-D-heptose 7-phosphate kinase/D-beta-D-heptose 1-phosphate adenosyltransferase